MSTMIIRCLVPGYEDYDPIGMERNAVAGFPDMWPEEQYAEASLWTEYKRRQLEGPQHYGPTPKWLKTFLSDFRRPQPRNIAEVLAQLAEEAGWQLIARDMVQLGMKPVYRILPRREQTVTTRRSLQQLLAELTPAPAASPADEGIKIDYAALTKMMKDMLPDIQVVKLNLKRPRRRPDKVTRQAIVLQALIELADKNDWQPTHPGSHSGTIPTTYRI